MSADLERDDYVFSIRNRLIAEAFYLTGDIERYGTEFVRIREFLKDYPELALSVSEVGDFLKVELRQGSHIIPPVTPSYPPPVEKLLVICTKEFGREELQKLLGIKNKEHFLESYLKPAMEQGLLEMTIPDKPNSPLQKYRLTQKGRQWVEKRKKSK